VSFLTICLKRVDFLAIILKNLLKRLFSEVLLFMGGHKDDLDDLDDTFLDDAKDDGDDDYSFDDDDDEEGGAKGSKKGRSESGGFDRDSYYFYKDKLVQLSGTIRPKERSSDGKVTTLDFKTDDKVYAVVMDTMGEKLKSQCFQEILVTGLVSKISEKEFTIVIKTFL
jgi:hypothetical protein